MPPPEVMCTISSYPPPLRSKADMPLHVYMGKQIPAHPSNSVTPQYSS